MGTSLFPEEHKHHTDYTDDKTCEGHGIRSCNFLHHHNDAQQSERMTHRSVREGSRHRQYTRTPQRGKMVALLPPNNLMPKKAKAADAAEPTRRASAQSKKVAEDKGPVVPGDEGLDEEVEVEGDEPFESAAEAQKSLGAEVAYGERRQDGEIEGVTVNTDQYQGERFANVRQEYADAQNA